MDKLIYGKNTIIEFLRNNNIPKKLLIKKGIKKDKKINFLINFCKNNNVILDYTTENELNKLTKNKNHQGLAIFIENTDNINYIEIEVLIEKLENLTKSCVVLLDSIQDTHNMGAIIRSAEFFGITAVIIPMKYTAPINDTVYKTSSGAINKIYISKINNLKYAVKLLKESGFWIYGTYLDEGKNLNNIILDKKTAFILGSEGKGLKKSIKDNCDFLIYIKRLGEINSLNVSVTSGILFYEYSKQHIYTD